MCAACKQSCSPDLTPYKESPPQADEYPDKSPRLDHLA
ncbi:hypothetical protein ALQ78_101520 [Pseudomonas syringae pv. aptata]|nr:Unknown protein sequence [Pseudomonas syringae pv. syringae]RMM41563.1 hypothetical protein ALQ78_101520 [Pseudomonas syringae pv. aptata]RMS22926.1 hypothetical protein ALP69_101981 [Pseudomonas syringae pv. aceris]RMS61618.1 hypothetical protein ALP63_102432 [Pseudomonas syringae pv. aceris]RMS62286.1 hypothetical protein ALP62_102422 [Pseudomonas syringae pv. aceris]